MKIITPSVSIQHYTPQGLIATAARASYQSYGNEKMTDEALIRSFLKETESPLEFAWAMVSVTCSYAAHVHFLRHRHMSQSWLSQRYTEGLGFVEPATLTAGELPAVYTCAEAEYGYLREDKARRQDARYVLPQGTAIQGWMAGNARAWINLLRLRTSKAAMPEVRHVAGLIQDELAQVWPLVIEARQ
jgi:thymidylate synthase (FAD)